MKFTPLSLVIALGVLVTLVSAGTAIYAAGGVYASAANSVRHHLSDVKQRDRVRYGPQPGTTERNKLRREQLLEEQRRADVFEEAAPSAEFTVAELVERCLAAGFRRSRLSNCLGNAARGEWVDE